MDAIQNKAEREHRGVNSPAVDKNLLIFGMFLLGIVLGVAIVFILVAHPLQGHLARLEGEVSRMQSSVELLAGERSQAWEAGHLLADLTCLGRQVNEARTALTEIRELRNDLIEEGEQTRAANEALANLARLQNFALAQEEITNSARTVLGEMSEIQQRLVEEHVATPKAQETLADLDRVRRDLADLLSLKAQIAQQAGDVAAAKSTADELLALKNDIVAGSEGLEEARSAANRLMVMQDELKNQGEELGEAFKGLDRLVELKDKLIDQTPAVADAVQNLEILTDFREELADQIQSLTKMRDGLMQIVMMESSIGRVAKLIEPLAQISNVRRLSDQEMRAAARSILDSRTTRLGSQRDSVQDVSREATNDPFLLPSSKADSSGEILRDGLVPQPVPFPVTPN